MVSKFGLEVHDHPSPYPLRWVINNMELIFTKQCKIKLSISVDYIDEVEVDIAPLDVCGVVFGIPYMYKRDTIFIKR